MTKTSDRKPLVIRKIFVIVCFGFSKEIIIGFQTQ